MPDTSRPTMDPPVQPVPEDEGLPATPAPGDGRGVTGRDRLRSALLHPRRNQVVVAVLLAVVGFAAVVQVRTNDVDDSYSEPARAGPHRRALRPRRDLAARALRDRPARAGQARPAVRLAPAQVAALEQAQQQADTLNILAGLVPVTGPGIRVTITEQTGPVDIDSVLDTIEELRSAGAEAMQFNGQVRVVAQTSLEDEVGGFSVDGTLLTSPYVIDVIGDPHTLHGALVFNQGPASQLRDDGADVQIDELETIDIESVRAAGRPEFAQPE